jgi:hypothetical protein
MRRWLLFVLVVVMAATLGLQAGRGIELRGTLSANDMEKEEGYFAIAEDTMIMVRPGSEFHHWLRRHAGQTVRIVIEPAETR